MFLLLPVFCEKTERILQDVVCFTQFCIFSLKLKIPNAEFLFAHRFCFFGLVLAVIAPIRQRVIRDS